ncbi:MAG: hypothetical protein ACRC8S_02395 [Fimbriiglobus sp.]
MTDFDIQAHTRCCAASGRGLSAGEKFYAALMEDEGKYVRKDFAADGWAGPPAGAIAFWSGRVPESHKPRKPTWNDELLADWFQHLAGRHEPDRVNFRYVVALLLMRRKRLKFEDVRRTEDGGSVLVVRDTRGGQKHEIPDPRLSEAEIEAVQAEVFRVLGWE